MCRACLPDHILDARVPLPSPGPRSRASPAFPVVMRRFFFAVVALLFAGLAALGWYVYDRGLTRHWRNYLVHQFRSKGLVVSMKQVTLNPFRGLIAREVKIYDVHNRSHVLAIVDEVVLGVNYANAVRGKSFLDSIDLRDARVSLPLDFTDRHSETVDILHLNARLFFPPQQIFLSHAEAEIDGVRVAASGKLINSQAWTYERPLQESPGAVFAPIAASLKQVRYDNDQHPLLSIEFSGDLLHPERIAAKVRLQAAGVHRRRCHIQRLDLAASCRGGAAELQQLDVIEPGGGELHANGAYDLVSHRMAYHVKSTIDLQALNRAFEITKALDDFTFHEPPHIEVMAHGTYGSKGGVCTTGHLEVANFSYRGEDFRRFAADASWEGDQWSMRDASLGYSAGSLAVDAVQTPGLLRGAVRGSIDPKAFRCVISRNAMVWLTKFEIRTPPLFDLKLEGAALGLDTTRASGDISLNGASFSGVAITGSCPVRFDNGLLAIYSPPGSATPWSIAFDFKHDEAQTNVQMPAVETGTQ